MEQFFSQHILQLIEQYGAFGMFMGGFIEEIISIIPTALIQLTGGLIIMKSDPISLTSLLKLFFIVAIPSALGYTLGSLPYFILVKKGGLVVIEKYGRFLGFSKDRYDTFTKSLTKRNDDEMIFWFMRLTPMLPGIFCNVYAGLTQMKMRTFLLITFIGVSVRAIIVAFIGWQLYRYITILIKFKYYAFGALVLVFALFYLIKTKKRGIK